MMKAKQAIMILALTGALGACSNVKQTMGVGRNSPDEFTVVKRAPLTLPPDYALRPPGDGSAPAQSQPVNQARTILLGAPASTATPDNGEAALLQKAGASSADPNVRREIDRENGIIAIENKSVADKLIFWKESEPALPTPPVVDPRAEAERLKKNAEEGKPANEGDVPVIERKKSTIERIF